MCISATWHIDVGDSPDDVGICERDAWCLIWGESRRRAPHNPGEQRRWRSTFLHAPADLGLSEEAQDEIYEFAAELWRAERRAVRA